MNDPVQFTVDLADLLGSPHHTFTRQALRALQGKSVPLRQGQGGPQIGYGVIAENHDTEHFYMQATVTASPALFADTMASYNIDTKECTYPFHGRDGRMRETLEDEVLDVD